MTLIEQALLCTLYAMYLYECVFWLGPAEQAFTRVSATGWKISRRQPLSFTLLGRTPVLADPLLLRPGFIRRPVAHADSTRTLRSVALRLDALPLLLTLCRLQALLLLAYLPTLIFLHRLARLALPFACVLLLTHTALCFFVIRAFRRARPTAWRTPALSLALNPLGATRAFDLLAETFFDQAQTRKSRHRKGRPPKPPAANV